MVAPSQQPSNLEVILEKFITGTSTNMQELKTASLQNIQAISRLQYQMDQLATKISETEPENFPSQTIPNPKSQYDVSQPSTSGMPREHVQAVTTLHIKDE